MIFPKNNKTHHKRKQNLWSLWLPHFFFLFLFYFFTFFLHLLNINSVRSISVLLFRFTFVVLNKFIFHLVEYSLCFTHSPTIEQNVSLWNRKINKLKHIILNLHLKLLCWQFWIHSWLWTESSHFVSLSKMWLNVDRDWGM